MRHLVQCLVYKTEAEPLGIGSARQQGLWRFPEQESHPRPQDYMPRWQTNDKTFLIITNMKTKEEMVFDFDGAIVLNAIITDYVENGNLNKVEQIFSEQEQEDQGE